MKCFDELLERTNYKILIIGREVPQHLQSKKNIRFIESQNFTDFIRILSRTKVLFVPSVHDASPRILTQAMTMGVGIVVNKYIVGGWHYVNKETGGFFSDEGDIVSVVNRVIKRQKNEELSPRRWYQNFFKSQP